MATSAPPERNFLKRIDDEGGAMSFFDHLVELRKRIISALAAVGLGMVVGLLVAKRFIYFIIEPMMAALRANHLEDKLYYTSPAGGISLVINLGLYLGIVLAMPWVLYQIWLFVAPGLYKHERKAVASFIVSAMFLFLGGIAFGYFVMLPKVLSRVIGFMNDGPIKPLISVNEYFSLIVVVLVGLGIIFEMPVVIFILSLFGIVTPRFLLRNFRYAMLLITVLAAIVTPTPDATTMLVFMAPMIVLYFVSVLVSYVVLQRKAAQARAEAEGKTP
jgi:sec-independent protein translocase protein TatC